MYNVLRPDSVKNLTRSARLQTRPRAAGKASARDSRTIPQRLSVPRIFEGPGRPWPRALIRNGLHLFGGTSAPIVHSDLQRVRTD